MSPEHHIHPQTLLCFAQGELGVAERREVIGHLLAGCESCRREARRLWAVEDEPALADRLGEGQPVYLERVLSRVREREQELDRQREQAADLFALLEMHPPGRQAILVRNSARFWTWGLCELLLERSWCARFDDPAETLNLAELAAAVADRLDEDYYGPALICDLRARAWAYVANAHRIRSDYRAAHEAFGLAEALLSQGTGDPLERARVLQLESTLYEVQGAHTECFRTLDRVIGIYERLGDRHLVGVYLMEKGRVSACRDDPDHAIDLLCQGLELVDMERDPRMVLVAKHNLVYSLREKGDLEGALSLAEEIRPLYAQFGDRISLLKLRGLQGQIAASLGRGNVAEAYFLEARNGFIAEGMAHEAASLSLELAVIYAEQRRTHEIRQLATHMIPIFQSRDLHTEAVAALMVFQRAAETEAVSVALAREVLSFLHAVAENPKLEFRRA